MARIARVVIPNAPHHVVQRGNRLSLKDNEGTQTYTYDNTYRLTSVIYPLGTKLEYAYDNVGNRLTLKKNGAIKVSNTYFNRVLSNKLCDRIIENVFKEFVLVRV